MDKKKIRIYLSISIGVLLVMLLGTVLWQKNKLGSEIKNENQQQNDQQTKENLSGNIRDYEENILFKQNGKTYEINIVTKEVKLFERVEDNLSEFSGLPKETKNKQFSISKTRTLLSQDKNKLIVVFTTFDETKTPSKFDGSLPVLSAKEFTCNIATKICQKTNYLASAFSSTGHAGDWFRYPIVWWYKWDSVNNILLGHLTGEGVGNASPVYIYNTNTKELRKTIGYDSLNREKEKRAEVPSGTFNPSLTKFVMVDENWNNNNSSNKWDLLLYASNNLLEPLKKIDISEIKDVNDRQNRVKSVAWSSDEKTLILETNKRIYTLNLNNEEITLRYSDTVKDTSGLWLNFNLVNLSPSGRYVIFVDYEGRNTMSEEYGMNTVLKAIDLKENNKVIELFRAKGISLLYD